MSRRRFTIAVLAIVSHTALMLTLMLVDPLPEFYWVAVQVGATVVALGVIAWANGLIGRDA